MLLEGKNAVICGGGPIGAAVARARTSREPNPGGSRSPSELLIEFQRRGTELQEQMADRLREKLVERRRSSD